MAFAIKRGMVLRTTRQINVKLEDGTTVKLASGARVKAMSLTDKGLKVKIKDKALDASLQGVHVETGWTNVKMVERGRPEAADASAPTADAGETPTPKAAKKATTKGKPAAKKAAAKKTTPKKAGGKKKAVVPDLTEGLEPLGEEEELVDLDDDFDVDAALDEEETVTV